MRIAEEGSMTEPSEPNRNAVAHQTGVSESFRSYFTRFSCIKRRIWA